MPRLDAYLKNTGLFARRRDAKRACEEGRVIIAGAAAKPAREPRIGDVLILDLEDAHVEAEILEIPSRPVPKKQRMNFVRVLHSVRRRRDEILSFDDDDLLP
jgi:ribosomal 50S subunit-recycling heat shock protein